MEDFMDDFEATYTSEVQVAGSYKVTVVIKEYGNTPDAEEVIGAVDQAKRGALHTMYNFYKDYE